MKNLTWPSLVYRIFAVANFAVAIIGFYFMVGTIRSVLVGAIGNRPTEPYFLQSFWMMTVINVCFLGLLVLGGIYLLRLSAVGVAVSNIVFVGEMLYFLAISFLWFPAWPRAISISVAGATGVGNMGISPQLISAYPLIGLGCLNLARMRIRRARTVAALSVN